MASKAIKQDLSVLDRLEAVKPLKMVQLTREDKEAILGEELIAFGESGSTEQFVKLSQLLATKGLRPTTRTVYEHKENVETMIALKELYASQGLDIPEIPCGGNEEVDA